MNKIPTIYPVILDDQSNFVKQPHKLGLTEANSVFRQWLHVMLAKRQTNLLYKHHWRKDCFGSVNLEAINYSFNVFAPMPAATLTMCVQKHRVVCLFLAPRVLHSEGGEFISLACFSISLCFLWLGGKKKCHHLLLGISQQALSLTPALSPCGKEWR